MLPIKFEGSQPIAKPPSMTDEECMSLEIFQGVTSGEFDNGHRMPFTLSCWQPSKEDIDAINAGRPIWVRVLSHTVHPISLFTLDEKDQINE